MEINLDMNNLLKPRKKTKPIATSYKNLSYLLDKGLDIDEILGLFEGYSEKNREIIRLKLIKLKYNL